MSARGRSGASDLAPILILGATSPVARGVAVEFARAGHPLLLTGRDEYEVEAVGADVAIRFGADVETLLLDALDFAAHPDLIARAETRGVGGLVVCLGAMADPLRSRADFDVARRVIDTNYTACVSLVEGTGRLLEERGGGFICVLGSVAGDRGRQSNYLYGSAKAGLATYLQGLRNRLHPAGVSVTTVKPGFVDTRMTYGKPGVFLAAAPEAVARSVVRAIERRRSIVYVPWFWRPIMAAIRAIPEPVFKRMKL